MSKVVLGYVANSRAAWDTQDLASKNRQTNPWPAGIYCICPVRENNVQSLKSQSFQGSLGLGVVGCAWRALG